MPDIKDITNTPIVRDDATPDLSQIGLTPMTRASPIDPTTSCLLGSITYDREHGFNLEWDSKEAFRAWLDNEQIAQSIELRPFKIERGSALYTTNQIFRCTRNGTGGVKHYQKKTAQEQKIENKHLPNSCPCCVQIKMYLYTTVVLGKYISNHSHAIGMQNLKFVWMRDSTWEIIASMLRYRRNDKNIVSDPLSDND